MKEGIVVGTSQPRLASESANSEAVRVEKIGDATLYLGDCRDVLPTLPKVGAVITDPPYGLGDRMQGGTWGAAPKYATMRQWDQLAPADIVATLLALDVPTIIWGGNYFPLPESRCWLAWDKLNAVPTMADLELAWTNLDRPAKRLRLPVGVHEHGHPTEKPLALMAWCLAFVRGASVLDPFMGSGTTGVACISAGVPFVGVEREPAYFDIACRRIEEAYRQPRLFAEPPPKAVQPSLLDEGLNPIGPVVAKVAAQVLDKASERDQGQGEAA